VYGLVESVARGIGVLEDLGTLGCGGVAGLRTGRETLVHLPHCIRRRRLGNGHGRTIYRL
jgi:hypothetical protein